MSSRPFKFLDSYTQKDADIFFGRDKEIEELYTKVFQGRLLLVYGVSGSGKSSLVNCGLGSRFQPTDWLPINVRRKKNMLQDMIRAVSEACLTPITGNPSLKKALRSVYLDHFMPVYLILDQLEELFIFGDEEEQSAFISAIAKVLAASEELNVKVVLIIREEYLAQLTAFEEAVPDLFENRARLERMTWRNAVQAIEGPCAKVGIEVEPGFSEKLLGNIAAGRKDVELTYLQVYLDRVSDMAEKAGGARFSSDLLDRIGAMSDVLGQFLDEQVASFPDPERAMNVFKAFVSTRGTKKLITIEEAVAFTRELGKPEPADAVSAIVHRAVDLRLLKDQDDQGRYELRHDALAATIYEKISLFEKELIEIKQFVDNGYAGFQKRQTLLSDADLKYIAPYEDRLFLSKEQRAFIALSKKEASRKFRTRLAWGITVGSIVVIALTVLTIRAQQAKAVALEQKTLAERESARALSAEKRALDAKNESDRERAIADSLRDRALENARELQIAITQKDQARITALINEQKAIESSVAEAEARRQAQEKSHQLEEETQRTKAALEKEELANIEKERVNRINRASQIAQNSQSVDDAGLRGLMAVEAHRLMVENQGEPNAQEIVDALYRACSTLELKEPWKVGGLNGEPRTMVPDASPDKLLVMGYKGVLQSVDMKARSRSVARDLSGKVLAGDKSLLSPSRRQMLIAHTDGSFEAWSVATGQVVGRGDRGADAEEIRAMSSFGDEGPLVTGDKKGRAVLWSLNNGSFTEQVGFDAGAAIKAFEYLGTGEIACISGSGTILFVSTDGRSRKVDLPRGAMVTRSAADGSGNLVLGTSDGSLLLIAPKGTAASTVWKGTGKSCDVLAASANGRWLADVNSAGQLSVHDRSGGLSPLRIKPADGSPMTMVFGGDQELYLGYGDGKVVRVLITAEALSGRICRLVNARQWTKDEWQRQIAIGEMRNMCAP